MNTRDENLKCFATLSRFMAKGVVQCHPEYGEDSALRRLMGYVPSSEHSSRPPAR